MDLAASNVNYLLDEKQDAMMKNLDVSLIHEIVKKAFEIYRSDPNFDNRAAVEFLQRKSQCSSVFELLKNETEFIVQQEKNQ